MVNLVTGDLLDSEAQTLVNAVNCAGVMGKGIALAFKRRFPEMFTEYVTRCKAAACASASRISIAANRSPGC